MARRPIAFPARPPLEEKGEVHWPVEGGSSAEEGAPKRRLLDQPLSTNVGRSTDLVLSGTTRRSQNIVSLRGADDETAQLVTVTLFGDLVNPVPADFITDAAARIRWGSGGVQMEAEVDFQNGTTFVVSATFLSIDVLGSGSGTFRALAHVGYLPIVHAISPQRTIQPFAAPLAAGAVSPAIRIPNFAIEFRFQRTPTGAPYTINFLRQNLTLITSLAIGAGAGTGEAGPFRIPNDAEFVTITNGAVIMAGARMIFGLAL